MEAVVYRQLLTHSAYSQREWDQGKAEKPYLFIYLFFKSRDFIDEKAAIFDITDFSEPKNNNNNKNITPLTQ